MILCNSENKHILAQQIVAQNVLGEKHPKYSVTVKTKIFLHNKLLHKYSCREASVILYNSENQNILAQQIVAQDILGEKHL